MQAQANAYICDLAAYQPGLPVEQVARHYKLAEQNILKLASNENPLGASPLALKAARRALAASNRYPQQYELVQALAAHHQVDAAQVVIGNGSNDILDLVARVYLSKGDTAIISQHAFAMYHIATQSTGAATIAAPAKEYGHDLAAMLAAITPATKVIWIANPNNPTGTFIPYVEVREFVAKLPRQIIVVLDEAYYDYLAPEDQQNAVQWIAEHPNLIIVRTFSKVYGLAGLRVGYAIASSEVAELLNRVRLPFTSNGLAIAAASAALQDTPFVTESIALNNAGREQLLTGLRQMELECLPAYGNFVTFKVDDALETNEKLLRKGVIVRPLVGYGLPHHLRATIGAKAENRRFLEALQQSI
jgi:histidinol-phosphate aminotransferase